jgi:hypothetical protein
VDFVRCLLVLELGNDDHAVLRTQAAILAIRKGLIELDPRP